MVNVIVIIVILFELLFKNNPQTRQTVIKVKCKYNESTTKQSVLVNTMYIILREAFKTCWTSFEEKNFAIINKEKHKIEQIYIWNPMTTGFIM